MRQALPVKAVPCVANATKTAQIVLPSSYTGLTRLGEWVHALARANRLSERCAFRLELVLVEAITNAIDHGYASDSSAAIVVRATCEAGHVSVQIEDGGIPFDPTALPVHCQPQTLEEAPIGGLGVHFMRSYTQDWEYQRVGNTNRLCMTIACND